MKFCGRCTKEMVSGNRAKLVLVQLTVNGPLHLWHRSDFASTYFSHHITLCGRDVLLAAR